MCYTFFTIKDYLDGGGTEMARARDVYDFLSTYHEYTVTVLRGCEKMMRDAYEKREQESTDGTRYLLNT